MSNCPNYAAKPGGAGFSPNLAHICFTKISRPLAHRSKFSRNLLGWKAPKQMRAKAKCKLGRFFNFRQWTIVIQCLTSAVRPCDSSAWIIAGILRSHRVYSGTFRRTSSHKVIKAGPSTRYNGSVLSVCGNALCCVVGLHGRWCNAKV